MVWSKYGIALAFVLSSTGFGFAGFDNEIDKKLANEYLIMQADKTAMCGDSNHQSDLIKDGVLMYADSAVRVDFMMIDDDSIMMKNNSQLSNNK